MPSPSADPSRVVLIDDHHILRDLLKRQLAEQFDHHFEIVGEGGTGQEAIDLCRQLRPDLLVCDLTLSGALTGLEALRQIKQSRSKLKVLIFSGCAQPLLIAQALALGVKGFVHKGQHLDTLFLAMREVAAGGTSFDPAVERLATTIPGLAQWQTLTGREREVARLIAEGKSNKEAASLLGLLPIRIMERRDAIQRGEDLT